MPQASKQSPEESKGNALDTPAAAITLQSKGNLTSILGANSADTTPAMRGFDPKFRDIVDYIVKITHEIWEERGIGRLYDYYSTNMRIHTSNGDIYGRDQVIEATIQALAAFPNRRLYADEVIWSGNDDVGYYSSHRLVHEGNNWGHTAYGPPTGRKVSYRAIADCHVVEGVIVEEWLARDELALIHQLGFDVFELARQKAEDEAHLGHKLVTPGEPDRLQGQLPPAEIVPCDSADFNIEHFMRNCVHEVWNWRLLNRISDYYDKSYLGESASGRWLYGRNQYTAYVLSLLSPFPDLAVSVDHFCALRNDDRSYRTATRWTMRGTHTGPGNYGQATGKRIQIMGMSHHLVRDGRIIQEWTVFDEFALLKQLCAPS